MKILLIIFACLIVILSIIYMTKLHVFITYYHNGDNDELKIQFRAWKFIKYTVKVPIIQMSEDSPAIVVKEKKHAPIAHDEKKMKITFEFILDKIKEFKQFLDHVVGFYKIVKRFLKQIHIKELQWKSQIGFDDAALTGVVTGLAWSVKGIVIGIISNYMNLKKQPIIEITPNFHSAVEITDFQCMFSFRLGQAIIAGLLIVRHWKRRPNFLKHAMSESVKG